MDPKLQAQIDALTQGFKQRGLLGDLSPELLAFLSTQQTQGTNGGLLRGFDMDDGRTLRQYGMYSIADPNASPDAQSVSTDPSRVNWGQAPIDFMLNTDESNHAAVFGPDGRFIGYEQRQDDKDWRDVITVAAMLAGGYYGGTYLSEAAAGGGVGGSAGAGGGAGGVGAEGLSGMDLAADAAIGTGNNVMTAGEALSSVGGAAGTTGVNSMRAGEIANYGTNGSMPTSAAQVGGNMSAWDTFVNGMQQAIGSGAGSDPGSWANTLGNWLSPGGASTALQAYSALTGNGGGNTLGGLLGAYLGYKDSKDKTDTQTRDPWAPAQPYLRGLFSEGADLFGQYKQQPFSPSEQTAYGNYGNVLDFINANAPGLMSGFDATAAGKNQFQRGAPRQLIGNSYDPMASPVAWRPGLLGSFGTTSIPKGAK